MNQTIDKKRRIRNDILLAAVLLATATIAFFLLQMNQKEGAYVIVTVDGEETQRLPLEKDQELVITTGTDGKNRLVIEGGKARMEEANCPDGICVAHRAISKTGETIVCLPHKIVISIEGAEEMDILAG